MMRRSRAVFRRVPRRRYANMIGSGSTGRSGLDGRFSPSARDGQRPHYPIPRAAAARGRSTRHTGRARPVLRPGPAGSGRRGGSSVAPPIRSRCERTVRMLMYSWAAMSASVRPRATRGDQFPFPGAQLPRPGRPGLLRAEVGEHQGIFGRGGQAHRRAAGPAARARSAPSSCQARRSSGRRCSSGVAPPGCSPAPCSNVVSAAHTVTVSA